jgi:hypothetical protein
MGRSHKSVPYLPSLRKNNSGALEGLPLYLIILVVIAGAAIGFIIAILPPPIGPPATILIQNAAGTAQVSEVQWCSNTDVKVTVTDVNGKKVANAVVHFTGAGIDDGHSTDGNGVMTFTVSPKTASTSPGLGTITVEAKNGQHLGTSVPLTVRGTPSSPCP